jgi:prepilin-type N-terminal cleavage/methylation domain-containing protein
MTVTATSTRWKRRQRGFTLIEALVVLVLLGIVAIITFMGLRNVKEKTGLEAAAQSVKALMDEAPGEAIQRHTTVAVRWVASTRTFELVVPGGTPVIIDAVRLPDTVVFEGTDPTGWPLLGSDRAVACDEAGRMVDPSAGTQLMAPQAFQITLQAMNEGRVKPKYRYLVQVFPIWSCRVTKIRL